MMFVINGGIYALTAPIWGCMVDKFLSPKISMFLGSLFIASGFCLIGPASFVPLETYVLFFLLYEIILFINLKFYCGNAIKMSQIIDLELY